jgi:PAS domain S-box-containing protein
MEQNIGRIGQKLRRRLHIGSPIFGYALALLLVVISGEVRLVMVSQALNLAPFFLFYPMIAVTAYAAGFGPGIVAMAAAGIFGAFAFPGFPSALSWIALFLISPLLIAGFASVREMRDTRGVMEDELTRFRFVCDHAGDWLFLTKAAGEITYANRAATTALGGELTNGWIQNAITPAERELFAQLLRDAATAGSASGEFSFQPPSGSAVLVEATCTAVRMGDELVFHVGTRDISNRRELELRERQMAERLNEARRFESLGALAGGLAHDFNNLLTTILGNSALVRESVYDHPDASRRLDQLDSAVQRAAELIELLLASSGYRRRIPEAIDPRELIDNAISSLHLPRTVTLDVAVTAAPFHGDRHAFATLVRSLVSNAAESYAQAGGSVQVRVHDGPATCTGTANFEEGYVGEAECVGLIVEDQGSGMTDAILDRAFDPFFSTRFPGRGLGLPAVRGLVRAQSGRIWLRTALGEGTRVEVWLPKHIPAQRRDF